MGLAYERRGSGPPLVLLHGVGHRRQGWDAVVSLLTPHRTVITVDLPGHGESPALVTAGLPAVRAIAAEVFGFFDETGLGRPHIAGNSLGGSLALMAGAVGRAATVTALSPAGFWARRWEVRYARAAFLGAQFAGPVVQPFVPALVRSTVGRWLIEGAFLARPKAMTAEQAAADAVAFFAARDAVRAVMADPVFATDFAGDMPADVPVTIAWGTRDLLLPPGQARVARRYLPRARFVPLPGCGHVPMTDDPALVARVLLEGSELSSELASELASEPDSERGGESG
jgi:pimeloyl-ACP methyl ester carboxylesterase